MIAADVAQASLVDGSLVPTNGAERGRSDRVGRLSRGLDQLQALSAQQTGGPLQVARPYVPLAVARWTCAPRTARVQDAWPPRSPRTMATVGSLSRGTCTVFFNGRAASLTTVAEPDSLRAR
ncbi:hypothetical protein [Streptomyces scopuliridis]|uniref:hypothetical protein n=1 Tax=Streptomyces scopuliridis TaxID=452529 RepID=UPI003439A882